MYRVLGMVLVAEPSTRQPGMGARYERGGKGASRRPESELSVDVIGETEYH